MNQTIQRRTQTITESLALFMALRRRAVQPDKKQKPMNTKNRTALAVMLLLSVITVARADLIDLTPGGFTPSLTGAGDPAAYRWAQGFYPLDRAFVIGDVSGWAYANDGGLGGTYLFTDLFTTSPSGNAQVWWNLTGQPDGFWMSALILFGVPDVVNVYAVPWKDRFVGGPFTVTLPGSNQIVGITFAGENAIVPEAGATLGLLALSCIGLFGFKFYRAHNELI